MALVVLGVPPILTNTYFAVEGVDRDVVEAARGMGLTEAQILMRVELPLGLPLILAGIRIAAVFVIATATIAGIVGGGGLGDIMANQATLRPRGRSRRRALRLGARARDGRRCSRWRSARPSAGWLQPRRVHGRQATERRKGWFGNTRVALPRRRSRSRSGLRF